MPQALRYDIGKPTPLTFHHGNNNVILVVTLDMLTNLEKVTLNGAFHPRGCIDETIKCAAHLHAYFSL
jgi:hypothetical protein